MSEKNIEDLIEMFSNKKIKKDVEKHGKIFDGFKELLGCSNIERAKLPLEFENDKDYEKYVREYIKKYSNDITEYANKISLLNERVIVSESEEDFLVLYSLLMGLTAFLTMKEFGEKKPALKI